MTCHHDLQASCDVSVVDVNVHGKLSQTYLSTSNETEHVNYVFPVSSDAAVCAFTAVIDEEHTIKGIVKERKQAQRDFDTAVKAGKTAALLKHHTSQGKSSFRVSFAIPHDHRSLRGVPRKH